MLSRDNSIKTGDKCRGFVDDVAAFTLIEVLIALVIFSIALVALYKGNVINLRSEKEASDLSTAVAAAELLMNETITHGFPEPGILKGKFDKGPYKGYEWEKKIESLELPIVSDIRKVDITVIYSGNHEYTISTVISRYQ